jgi:hypothetical protein
LKIEDRSSLLKGRKTIELAEADQNDGFEPKLAPKTRTKTDQKPTKKQPKNQATLSRCDSGFEPDQKVKQRQNGALLSPRRK